MYELWLFLHLFSVIVGIGNTAMNPVYGVFAKNHPGPGGLAVSEANHKAGRIGEFFIYAIPIFGILLVLEMEAYEFGQTWIWLAIVLYVVALGLATGILFPTSRRMIELQRELVAMGPPPAAGADAPAGGPPPQVAELERLGKTVGTAGGVLHIIATVLIVLMVWKPGL